MHMQGNAKHSFAEVALWKEERSTGTELHMAAPVSDARKSRGSD